MAHSIEYETLTGVLVVKGTGTWTRGAFQDAISEAMPLVSQYACSRVLLDLREVTPAFTFPDVFAIMRGASASAAQFGVDAGRLKRACVLAPAHYFGGAATINYALTLMATFGQPVRFFEDDVERAMAWLGE